MREPALREPALRERDIEEYLRQRVKVAGGRAYKWVSPGNAGVPDRIVMLPGGRTAFVELKAPGKKPSPLQIAQGKKISNLGQVVVVIDSKQGVDEFITKLAAGGAPPWHEQQR